jgi:hypothetical protein
MNECCSDNRFELIEKYKKKLCDETNIEMSKDEMAVIDSILFRFWQMGWLQKIDRKQSEWISVEERLPERNGRYLTHCNVEGQSLVCILYYCKVGGFNDGAVTHWMPLPEPPMKGEGDEENHNGRT